MKRINIPLIVGLIIVLAIVFLVFFGEYLAPFDASVGEQSLWVVKDNGERVLMRAPFAPNKTYKMGTDNGGRDVLSVIMAGARNTFTIVLLATLLRFLVAIPIAFFAAFGESISKKLIVIFSSIFSAVPSLLICIIILKLDVISNLDLRHSIMAFVIVFTIVGWGRLASIIEEKIKEILNQDFIQGAVAVGKSKFAIATQNIMAHIMPSIIIYTFLEIALVLLLLAQLGIFEVFVGNKQIFTVSSLGRAERTNFNFFPEWGAMLAATRRSIIGKRFWLSIYPLMTFSVSVVGFNLLGQGLNHELNKRNSMFISNVNRFIFHLSPKTFIEEVMHFKEKKRNVILKIMSLATVIMLITIPILNSLAVEDNDIMAQVIEVNKDEYAGRLIGTQGHEKYGKYIVEQLEKYEIEPLFDGNYISEFEIDKTMNIINKSTFQVVDEEGDIITELKYKVDYYFDTWASNTTKSVEGEILTTDDLFAENFDTSKDYILALSTEENQFRIYEDMVSKREDYKFIKAVVVPDSKAGSFIMRSIDMDEKGLTRVLDNIEAFMENQPPIKIISGKAAANRLWRYAGNKVTIEADMDSPLGLVGKNIGGIIKGKDSSNPLIIATSYDYLGFHDEGVDIDTVKITKSKGLYENGTSIAGILEIGRYLGDIKKIPDRTVILLFIDGSKVTVEGMADIENQGIFEGQPLLVYLRYMGITVWSREEDSLYHNTLVFNNNLNIEQEFHRWIRRNTAKSDYHISSDNTIRQKFFAPHVEKDMVAIVLQGIKQRQIRLHDGMTQNDIGDIDMDRLRTHVQCLLDSILDMAYGGKGWTR